VYLPKVQAATLQLQMATLKSSMRMAQVLARLSRTSPPIWPCLPSILQAEALRESRILQSQMVELARALYLPRNQTYK